MTDSKNWFEKILDKINYTDDGLDDEKIQPNSVPKTISDLPEYVFGELKKLLKEHTYRKKTGEIISPPKIVVFWSEENDSKWCGARRRALIEDLESIVVEFVSGMAGTKSSETAAKVVDIELKADMMIRDNAVRLETEWDEAVESVPETETVAEVRIRTQKTRILPDDYEKTLVNNIADDEKTIPINKGGRPRFSVEIWHSGEMRKERDFFQDEINIGRDSESKGKVDLNLSNDSRVARHHAILQIDNSENFWITAVGDNQLSIDEYIIPQGKTVQVKENQEIRIIDFTLTLMGLVFNLRLQLFSIF